ncbi:MAG: dethiobiotin synthase [Gammaproteobacteria bacterium]
MKQLPHLFVTGTDTGIGKSIVTAGLLRALAGRGLRVAGMKPIAAGASRVDGVLINEDAELLRACANLPLTRELVCPCLYEAPTAPHLAAAAVGETIDLARIAAAYATLRAQADVVLVEGIGGWALPLSETAMLADLPRRLGLPVLLVVGVRLGALNHGLLTARAIVDDGLPLAGWIANVLAPDYAWAEGTIETLAARVPAPLLARVPFRADPTPDTIAPFLAAAAARLAAP